MGNFLSQFNDLVNRDADSKVPDVQLDFEGKKKNIWTLITNYLRIVQKQDLGLILLCVPFVVWAGRKGVQPNPRKIPF